MATDEIQHPRLQAVGRLHRRWVLELDACGVNPPIPQGLPPGSDYGLHNITLGAPVEDQDRYWLTVQQIMAMTVDDLLAFIEHEDGHASAVVAFEMWPTTTSAC